MLLARERPTLVAFVGSLSRPVGGAPLLSMLLGGVAVSYALLRVLMASADGWRGSWREDEVEEAA